jgi:glucosamine--fructose-6-phosphate aminotransferase (isomerizing)
VRYIEDLLHMPQIIEQAIKASAPIEKVAERFHNRTRLPLLLVAASTIPIALEGALKLKEISYIHAGGLSRRRDEARTHRAHRRSRCRSWPLPLTITCSRRCGQRTRGKGRGASVIAVTTAGDDRMAGVLDSSKSRNPADAAEPRRC